MVINIFIIILILINFIQKLIFIINQKNIHVTKLLKC